MQYPRTAYHRALLPLHTFNRCGRQLAVDAPENVRFQFEVQGQLEGCRYRKRADELSHSTPLLDWDRFQLLHSIYVSTSYPKWPRLLDIANVLAKRSRLVQHNSRSVAGLAKDCRVGLRWNFHCGCPISKRRPVLNFSLKNQGPFFCLFDKSQHELIWSKNCVLGDFVKKMMIPR